MAGLCPLGIEENVFDGIFMVDDVSISSIFMS